MPVSQCCKGMFLNHDGI